MSTPLTERQRLQEQIRKAQEKMAEVSEKNKTKITELYGKMQTRKDKIALAYKRIDDQKVLLQKEEDMIEQLVAEVTFDEPDFNVNVLLGLTNDTATDPA